MGLARPGRRKTEDREDRQCRHSSDDQPGPAPRDRRLGARLLSRLPEPPEGLPHRRRRRPPQLGIRWEEPGGEIAESSTRPPSRRHHARDGGDMARRPNRVRQPEAAPRRATRIVATIGPKAVHRGYLEGLLRAGADLLRINGAHARRGEIAARIALIRKLEKSLGRPVGILLDLGGPKIRVGPLEGDSVTWKAGDRVEIVPGSGKGSGRRIFVTYPALLSDVHPGAEIRIDDGKISLRVERHDSTSLTARVLIGGRVQTEKGVNFPGSTLSAPALTAKDRRDLAEAVQAGVDFVGLSFVRSARQIEHLRGLLQALPDSRRPWIVAK